MNSKDKPSGALYVPAIGEIVTYVLPQQKKITNCTVTKLFDNKGRVRVKAPDGTTYSGSLDQILPE